MGKLYLAQLLTNKDRNFLFKEKGLKLGVAPTGSGKTFVIVNEMKTDYEAMETPFGAKRVLLLVNRSALLEQYLESIDSAFMEAFETESYYVYRDCVHICSYQKAYMKLGKNPQYFENFDLILMDEAHYFLQDSWNGTTDEVFNQIMKRSKEIPCTMFTATPEELIHYTKVREIRLQVIDYTAQLAHNRITCVATNKDFREIINAIPVAEKYILFVNHKYTKKQIESLAEELSTDVRCVGFYYSKWNKLGKRIIKNALMDERYKNLVKFHKFEEDGAIANSAVDNGVDFKDESLKHIILLDQYDPVTMKQMIGRKRFNFNIPSDTLKAWVVNTDRKFLEQEREHSLKQISMYRNYKKLNGGEFIEKYADRLKHIGFYNSMDNSNIVSASTSFADDEIVPCINVTMKRIEQSDYFAPLFTVNFCLVAKSDYKLKYLSFLLDAKIQLNDDEMQYMALHKVMAQQLEDMGFKNVFIDHKNWFHEKQAEKLEQASNVEQNLVPFLEGQLGKSMDKDTFKEFREFLFSFFGVKTDKNKIPGKGFVEQFLLKHNYKLFTSTNAERKTIYVVAK